MISGLDTDAVIVPTEIDYVGRIGMGPVGGWLVLGWMMLNDGVKWRSGWDFALG